MTEGEADAASREVGLVEKLGKMRDGLLLTGGAVYVLGYMVWSTHALFEGIGLLPALEPQYLLAGTAVAIVLCAGLGLIYLLRRWFFPVPERRTMNVRLALVLVVLACIGAISFSYAGVPLVGLACLVTVGGLMWLDTWFTLGALALSSIVTAFTAAGTLVLYVAVIYPQLPQEIGGVKPRCAYVEVARGDLSPTLARNLFSASRQRVTRSRELSIFFSGGATYVVRARRIPHARIVEIRKDVVLSVINC